MNENTNYLDKVNHYNQILKKYFGYDKLKDKQAEIIYNVSCVN